MSTLFTLPPCAACAGRGYTRSYDGERQECASCLGANKPYWEVEDELGYVRDRDPGDEQGEGGDAAV